MATAQERLDSIIQQADTIRGLMPPRAIAPWLKEALERIDGELDDILTTIEEMDETRG